MNPPLPPDYAPPAERSADDRDHALRFWVSFATSGWTTAAAMTIALLVQWRVIP